MGRAQSDTYSLMFNKSDNVKVDETFVRKSVLVHVLSYTVSCPRDVGHFELTWSAGNSRLRMYIVLP